MKNTNLNKIVCAAVAGIMLALTACGEVNSDRYAHDWDYMGSRPSSSTAETVLTPDEPAPDESTPDIGGSSKAVVAEPDTKPDDEFYEAYNNYAAELFIKTCDPGNVNNRCRVSGLGYDFLERVDDLYFMPLRQMRINIGRPPQLPD